MRKYTQLMHESVVRKIKTPGAKRLITVRLGGCESVNELLIDELVALERDGHSLSIMTRGKSSLPRYCILQGFEVDKLKNQISKDARRSLVTLELRERSEDVPV